MVLTKIDLKVLDFACLNGCQLPEAEIASRLRLKPGTVSYSLKKMEREKVIFGYRFRVNYARLGLGSTAWVFIKVKVSDFDLFLLLDEFLKFPQVHVASFITGEYDLVVKVIERDVYHIDDFVRCLSHKFKDSIVSSKVLLVTKNYKTHNVVPEEFGFLPGFDETDLKILDCRLRFPDRDLGQIASELGLHRNTVSKRWRGFWKKNVLVKKTPVVSPLFYQKLKLALKAVVLIDAVPEASDKIAEKLVNMPEVHELNRLLDGYSLMAIVRTSNIPDFLDFIRRVLYRENKGLVRSSNSTIVLGSKPHAPDYIPGLLARGILKFEAGRMVCGNSGLVGKEE